MRESYSGDGTSSTLGPAHSFYCNRRYSRIAREIIRQWLIPILKGYSDLHPSQGDEVRVEDVNKKSQQLHYSYQEVDIIVNAISETSEDCVLDPRRDVFQYQDSNCFKTISLACIDGCENEELKSFDGHGNHLTESRKRCVSIMENCFLNSLEGEIASAMTHDLIYHFCFQLTTSKSSSYRQNHFRVIPSYPYHRFSSIKSFGNASYKNSICFLFPLVLSCICLIILGCYCSPFRSQRRDKSD